MPESDDFPHSRRMAWFYSGCLKAFGVTTIIVPVGLVASEIMNNSFDFNTLDNRLASVLVGGFALHFAKRFDNETGNTREQS